MKLLARKTLQGIILYIHVFTRTPAILVFYSIMFFGVFAEKTKGSSFCFIIFIGTVFLNVLLIVLFNTSYTKKFVINLVGPEFQAKYLSHSTVGSKSLARITTPIAVAYVFDTTTGILRNNSHSDSVDALRDDAASQYQSGNRRMGDETSRLVGAMEKDYVYGGVITQTIRHAAQVDVQKKAMDTGGSVVQAIFSRK